MSELFSWCNIMFVSTAFVIMSIINLIFLSNFFWDFINHILLLGTLIISGSVIFDVKLYSPKFDYIASI
jgi:hypothetical protein